MCFDPISIGLLVAGTAASFAGSQIASSEAEKNTALQVQARNAQLRKLQETQRALEEENRGRVDKLVTEQYSPESQAQLQADTQAQRAQAIETAVTPSEAISEGAPLTGDAPNIIKEGVAKKLRDVFNQSTENARLQAVPQSFSDVLAMNNIALGDAGRYIDTLNSFAKQEAALLPSQQDLAAYAASKTPSGWGNLLKSAGSAAAGFGGSGYLRPAAAASLSANPSLALMPTNI